MGDGEWRTCTGQEGDRRRRCGCEYGGVVDVGWTSKGSWSGLDGVEGGKECFHVGCEIGSAQV